MAPNEFLSIGIDLYGEDWANELSNRTGLNRRTIQRMATGHKDIPQAVAGLIFYLDETAEFWRKVGALHE